MPLSTEEILARRVRWQAYARSINGHRTSDELMAEIRGSEERCDADVQTDGTSQCQKPVVPQMQQ